MLGKPVRSRFASVGLYRLMNNSARGHAHTNSRVGDGRVRAMLGVDAMQALLFTVHIPSEVAVFIRDAGGRFTRFGEPDMTFVSACRQTIDLVADDFPPRAE